MIRMGWIVAVAVIHFVVHYFIATSAPESMIARVLGMPMDLLVPLLPFAKGSQYIYFVLQLVNSLVWASVLVALAAVTVARGPRAP